MACVATVLQAPDAPDLGIDARLRAGMRPQEVDLVTGRELNEWLAGRGLRMRVHERAPLDSDRCIGVVPLPGWFKSHCLVLRRGELLHDPAGAGIGIVSRLLGVHIWDETDVTWGMSFVETESKGSF